MNEITQLLHIDPLLLQALREDIPEEDVSTNAVMPHACPGTVDLIAKEDGIVAGLAVYARVFTLLDPGAKVEFFCRDGDTVQPGQKLAVVTGDIRALLSGERVALNYLQRMSGIATYTHQLSALLEGTGITLLDTRKTSPNNRIFEKYAVRVGGGSNHRTGLSDGVLLRITTSALPAAWRRPSRWLGSMRLSSARSRWRLKRWNRSKRPWKPVRTSSCWIT